jgi:hypothetical protein
MIFDRQALAIIDAICRNQPLDPSWQSLCGMP